MEEIMISIKKTELEQLIDTLEDVLPPKIDYRPNYIEMLQEAVASCQEAIELVHANLLNRLR